MEDKQSVRVTILSRSYTLRVAGDPREIEAVASSVNDLMLSIAGKVGDADSTRIAVLACLHLADKLRALERQTNQVKQGVDPQLVEQLIAAVEEAVV